MKIVINRCYGGYGLSDRAVRLYAEKKGLTLYTKKTDYGSLTYFTIPVDEAEKLLAEAQDFDNLTQEQRDEAYDKYKDARLYDMDIPRNDETLVEVVEELGSHANGRYADLTVVDIPDDVDWEIDDYDGMETVVEVHRRWF